MTDHRIELGPETMAWHDRGDRAALLLVHGFPLDHGVWDPQVRGFSNSRRVLAPDLVGFGASSAIGRASIQEHADDLARGMDLLAVSQAVVVGLSMGGYVAMSLWARHPERCAGLVLVSTRATADSEPIRQGRRLAASTVARSGTSALAESMLPELLGPEARDSLGHRIVAMVSRQPPDGVIAALGAMAARPSYSDLLATVTVPTLVVVGAHDSDVFLAEARLIAKEIADCRLAVVPRAGHLVNIEEPGAFNAALRDYLASLDPA